jgi:hypothetical protein
MSLAALRVAENAAVLSVLPGGDGGFMKKGGPHIELMVKLLVWLFLIKLIIMYFQMVVLSAALGRLKARK